LQKNSRSPDKKECLELVATATTTLPKLGFPL
jgi:hypothetical protein